MALVSVGVHAVLWPLGNQALRLAWDLSAPPLEDEPLTEVQLIPLPSDPDRSLKLPGPLMSPDEVDKQRKPDEDTERVSEYDSRVEKETAAPLRERADRYDATRVGERSGMGSPAKPGGPSQSPTPPAELTKRPDPKQPAAEPGDPNPNELPVADYGDPGKRDGGGSPPAPRVSLRGSASAMHKTFGGSGSHDDTEGLDEGPQTLINSHRFRFASFFNRMRDQIDEHWDPNEVMNRIDPDRRVYGERTRKTLLHIRLTPEGAVKAVRLVSDSGVIELDKEAISSVHLAAPFVNPPPELVDPKTGFIEIDFGFSLLHDRSTARIRRIIP